MKFDIDKAMAELPDASHWGGWTPEMDKYLLALWPTKEHKSVAEVLGYSPNSCRARFRRLTREHTK